MLKDVLKEEMDEKVDINLSPMIDCIFILLIFFILTTVFVQETGIEVDKPETAGSVPLDQNSILIGITADERVFYGGQEIGVSGVRPTIRRILLTEDVTVVIQSDKNATHGVFARVFGEAKAAGAEEIHFSTDSVLRVEEL